jgi:AcrR family transcriptional regulator
MPKTATQKAPRKNARNTILDVAETIIVESGTAALTVDAVALVTGIGKGGVLYHFPFKADMLKALLQRQCDRYEQEIAKGQAERGGGLRAWFESFIELALNAPHDEDKLAMGVFGATAFEPKLHEPTLDYYNRRLEMIRDNCENPGLAMIVVMAMEDLIAQSAQGCSPLDDRARESVREALGPLLDQIVPKQ